MATKFLFYTDIHFAGETPRNRKDDFPQTLLEKQREIYQIAESENCDFIAFGGDYFNFHRVYSFPILADTMDIVDGVYMPTYMVIGEHDLYGHNMESFPNSTLAFMARRCRNIRILREPIQVTNEVRLYPKHETDRVDVMAAFEKPTGICNICLCHELLTPQKGGVFECFNTTDIGPTGFDLVLSGDLHSGYPIHEANNTVFCNPGSIARRTVADADRMPQVAIVSVETPTSKPEIELRQLKCAKVGAEVFELDGEAQNEFSKDFEPSDFTKDLIEIERHSADIYDFIKEMAKQNSIPQEVIDYLFNKREQIKAMH